MDLDQISRIATQAGRYQVTNLPNSAVEQFLLFLRTTCPYVSSVTATPNSDLTSTILFEVTSTLRAHNPFSSSHLHGVNSTFASSLSATNQLSQITRSADVSYTNTFSSNNFSSHLPSDNHPIRSSTSIVNINTSNTSRHSRSAQERVSAQEISRSRSYTEQVYQRSSSYRPLGSRIDSYRPPPRADRYNPYRDNRRQHYRRSSPSSSPPPPPPPLPPPQRPPSTNPLFLLLEDADDERPTTPSWKRL